jgi:hypothetical protein
MSKEKTVRDLFPEKETKTASALRDRLVEIAGDREELVSLMEALNMLPKPAKPKKDQKVPAWRSK